MDYATLNDKLQGRNQTRRKLANNTYAERRGEDIAIRLHATDVLTFSPDGAIMLDSGGWRTSTTKQRMNEYLSGWAIRQDHGQWSIERENPKYDSNGPYNPEIPFWNEVAGYADGAILKPDGTVENGEPLDTKRENLKLRRRVQRFAAKYMDAFGKGLVPAPSAGDCLYCSTAFRTDNGQTLGETSRSADHILSHLDENYFVPSLLARAFETMPHSPVMGWAIEEKWASEGNKPKVSAEVSNHWFDGFAKQQLQKILARYILRQVGQAS